MVDQFATRRGRVAKQVLDCMLCRLKYYDRINSGVGDIHIAEYLDDSVLGYMLSGTCAAPS